MSAYTYTTAPEGDIPVREALMGLCRETRWIDIKTHSHNLVGLYFRAISKAGFTERNLADVAQYYGITHKGEGGGWVQFAEINPYRHEYFQKFLDEDEKGEEMKEIIQNDINELMRYEDDEEDEEDED